MWLSRARDVMKKIRRKLLNYKFYYKISFYYLRLLRIELPYKFLLDCEPQII